MLSHQTTRQTGPSPLAKDAVGEVVYEISAPTAVTGVSVPSRAEPQRQAGETSHDAALEQNRSHGKTLRVAPILLGLLAPLAIIAVEAILLVAPTELASPLCAALYSGIVICEVRARIYSPQSLTLLGCFVFYTAVAYLLPEASLRLYAGEGILAVLILPSLVFLALGLPIATFYAQGRGPMALHYATGASWIATYVLGTVAFFGLRSTALSAVVPLGFAILGAVATYTMNLVYCGRASRNSTEFALGAFTFRQLPRGDAALDAFLGFFADEIWAASSRDRRTKTKYSRDEILNEIRRTERESDGGRRLYFQAYHRGNVVGGIAAVLDGPDRRLPIEQAFGVTFAPLRRCGRVMEVRRLSIGKNYRLQHELIRGLFKCVIDVAFANDVSFIVDSAFIFAVGVLNKVGFETLQVQDRQAFEFGSPMRMLVQNLAARPFTHVDAANTLGAFREAVDPYLRYRYLQRLVLRQFWRPSRRRAWALAPAQIATLCVPTDQPPSSALTPAGRHA
jgi:hypothetical protein